MNYFCSVVRLAAGKGRYETRNLNLRARPEARKNRKRKVGEGRGLVSRTADSINPEEKLGKRSKLRTRGSYFLSAKHCLFEERGGGEKKELKGGAATEGLGSGDSPRPWGASP